VGYRYYLVPYRVVADECRAVQMKFESGARRAERLFGKNGAHPKGSNFALGRSRPGGPNPRRPTHVDRTVTTGRAEELAGRPDHRRAVTHWTHCSTISQNDVFLRVFSYVTELPEAAPRSQRNPQWPQDGLSDLCDKKDFPLRLRRSRARIVCGLGRRFESDHPDHLVQRGRTH